MQNLIYALIQVVHNFGAVTIVGLSAAGVWRLYGTAVSRRMLALLLAAAWAVQSAAGAAFGATTLWFEHQLPDIHGIAVIAIGLKIVCTVAGFVIALRYLLSGERKHVSAHKQLWIPSFTLGAIALTSAAFLRWFS